MNTHNVHYLYDSEDGEINLYVRNVKGKILYTESILGSFESDEAIKATVLEAVQAKGYSPIKAIDDEAIANTASQMGKRSAEVRKTKGHDSEYYKQLSAKRWGKVV